MSGTRTVMVDSTHRRFLAALAVMLAVSASPVLADGLPTRHVLSLDAALDVAAAAEAEAQRQGWPCVIAVVDSGGYLIAVNRMDASPMLASAEFAPAKARTAALFGKPSKVLEEAIHGGQQRGRSRRRRFSPSGVTDGMQFPLLEILP